MCVFDNLLQNEHMSWCIPSALAILVGFLGIVYLLTKKYHKEFDHVDKVTTQTAQRDTDTQDSSYTKSEKKTYSSEEKEIIDDLAKVCPAFRTSADLDSDIKKSLEDEALEFSEHIPGKVKQVNTKAAMKILESKLSDEEKNEENKIQHEQLEAIFKLMENQQEKFGVDSIGEVQSQMKLYM